MYNIQENGRRLRELRGDKTIETVAHEVGISPSALAMYERGERNPRDDLKVTFASYYGVTVADLFYAQ